MKKLFPISKTLVVGLLFLGAFGGLAYYFMGKTQSKQHAQIVEHIRTLSDIFKRINKSCQIVAFEKDKSDITFLNIKKDGFTGSQIGHMKLGEPKNWEGPYLEENPRIQDKYYQIVKAKQGYFIIPGDGVMLPNGKVINKDIIINEDTDMVALMNSDTGLSYNNQPLAALVSLTEKEIPVPDVPTF